MGADTADLAGGSRSQNHYRGFMSTGKIIRELREKSELEQEQLAELAGVSRTIVRLWEQDKNCPSVTNFEKVLNVLGYTLYVRPKNDKRKI